eukprot:13740820-Alexandrium_andersonii.AAC.1
MTLIAKVSWNISFHTLCRNIPSSEPHVGARQFSFRTAAGEERLPLRAHVDHRATDVHRHAVRLLARRLVAGPVRIHIHGGAGLLLARCHLQGA